MWKPVLAGFWTHRDLTADFFTFQDLLDIHEMMDVKEANETAWREWEQRK